MADALLEADIQLAMDNLPGWAYSDGMLSKTFHFDVYLGGVAFAAAVGTICEGMGHHPDMVIGYRKVTVRFTTHDSGNVVTQKDIDAALAVQNIGYPKAQPTV